MEMILIVLTVFIILFFFGIFFLAFHYIDEYLTKLSTIRRIKERTMNHKVIYIRYTNYAGITTIRKIEPIEIKFESNK